MKRTHMFFLNDNYLGLDEDDIVIPVDTCTGTAMTDPYRDDYSEFHSGDGWDPDCTNTLSHKTTGRWDWATIVAFYPWLDGDILNTGPRSLPLAVTQIQVVEPLSPTTVLDVPIFYLTQYGAGVQPGPNAQAFLFRREGDRLTDLGGSTFDKVRARGARPGDRLCLFELDAGRLGCETIQPGDDDLELATMSTWQPDVVLSPVSSRTVSISVTVSNPAPILTLQARLFPVDAAALPTITLSAAGEVYSGIFSLDFPAIEAYVQVWAVEDAPRREIVTSYALGGNPVPGAQIGYVPGAQIGYVPGAQIGYIPGAQIGYVPGAQIGYAPGISPDGQVILFGDLDFPPGEFYALQAATHLPDAPPWVTVVGQAYRLITSENAPELTGTTLNFRYLESQVPPGEESWLRLYRWDETTHAWEQLATRLDADRNYAFASVNQEGLYALMSSLEIPLHQQGWNLFAYPVVGTRPVGEALQSIEGYYHTVYGYVVTDTVDPWKVYGWDVPVWVNDLEALRFGQGYWINVTEPITLQLKGSSTAGINTMISVPIPPTTFYGPVPTGGGVTPEAGMVVRAWIGDHLCGQAETQEIEGEVWFSIDVLADDFGLAIGCGAHGRDVAFEVEPMGIVYMAMWNNDRVWALPMPRIYLPLILKNY